MTEPKWLTPEIVKGLHLQAIATAGGSTGVRDEGLLISAIERPRQIHAYATDHTIFALSAAYGFGILRNHPFIDGNKRAAILSSAVFLDLSGYTFRPDEAEAVHMVLGCAAGDLPEDIFAAWIEEFTTRKV